MSTTFVDLHCHLDLYPKPALAVKQCIDTGAYVLSVTTTPKAWRGTSKLAQGCSRIRTALGLHPQIAHERIGELALFDALLPETRYVGEVGLDGSPEFKLHWREQTHVFNHVLTSASRAGGRIITIHSRRATTEVLNLLAKHPDAGIPILHWFSGSRLELTRAIDMGCWFSVNPTMLQGKKGRELVQLIPPDRVLTETDGPFASVDGQPLAPAKVEQAVHILSTCWRVNSLEASSLILTSFRRLTSSRVGGLASIS